MFLRVKRVVFPSYINLSKRLLSNEIQEVLNTRLDPPSRSVGNTLQLSALSKNLNAINLDLFVNNLNQHEDRTSIVLDLLEKLRLTNLANTCLDSTHFAVVRHLLESLSLEEVVSVLLDRPKYGIFLNNFTGFAVVQALHEEKAYTLGLPLTLKLVLSEETSSEFINWFFLKASLETLRKEQPVDQTSATSNVQKSKVQEVSYIWIKINPQVLILCAF